MNLEEIKQYLNENKDNEDVKAYLGELSAVSADKVKGFLNTDEGKRLIQPDLDRYHNKSLESWKTNNLESIIEEEVRKRNPEKTPEQLKIEELEKKIQDAENARIRGELVNKAFKVADEKALPKDVIDFFIGENEEKTLENLSKFEETYTAALQKAVDERFKTGGREVPGGDKGDNSVGANFAKSANQPAQQPEKTIWD
jgi:polyhydroxyalkanoate synthesis regulator phasin